MAHCTFQITRTNATEELIMNRLRRPSIVFTVTILLASLAAGLLVLFGKNAKATSSAPASDAIPVSVAQITRRDVELWDEFSGRLEAVDRAAVRSRVAGTVQAVHFREGGLVRAGDVLFTIDPAPFQAEVERAEAQMLATQARLAYTKSELTRSNRLWAEQAIAQRELDERSNAAREAEANLRAAQAALQTARLALGYTQVRAPFDGRVGRIEVGLGNLVAAGPDAPVLTYLVSVSPIYASFDADERTVVRALAELRAGAAARAQIYKIPVNIDTLAGSSDTHTGRLQLVDNQVDVKSGTIRLRAVLDNKDGALTPGQFARIRMGRPESRSALLINERGIGTDQNKRFVLVVGADNKLIYREVELGAAIDGMRVIAAGLKDGETVVVNGLQRVRPGALVQPEVVPMSANAPIKGSTDAVPPPPAAAKS
jgi:multidrug efflux system membrane fusion protein